MEIIVDNREKDGPIPIFEQRLRMLNQIMNTNIKWKTEQITVGDFILRDSGVVKVIIERKTWSDLASSIMDGRATSQLKKMTDFRSAHGSVLIYIVEGKKTQSLRVTADALTTKLRRIALLSIGIIYTKNTEDTVDTVIKLANDLLTQRTSTVVDDKPITTPEAQTAHLHARLEPSVEEQLIAMWRILPGVGEKTAKVIHQNITIGEALRSKSPIDTIARINAICENCNVKITVKTRKALTYIMSTSKIAENENKKYGDIFSLELQKIAAEVLACINGLSVETAKIILDKYSLRDLCTNAAEAGSIADITRVSGKKLGLDLAMKIKNILGTVHEH